VRPALALSLHTTRAGLREQLLPRAPRIAPEELVAQCDAYARATGYPIQYQWTLLAGVNDDPAEFDTLARWLRGHYAVVNLIPYNALSGDAPGYSRPSSARIEDICRQLRSLGVLAKVRHSAGQEIDGGCGQLRARQSAQLRRVSA
jgi:23S rRNA (adenine2503-C2)-methyltransferase